MRRAWLVARVLLPMVLLAACITPVQAPPSDRASLASGARPAPASASPVPTVDLPDSPVDRVRIGLVRDPSSTDPAQVTDPGGRMVVDALFDSLTRISPDLRSVEASAASAWAVSDDGLTWRFTIDPLGVWHDGRPVVARDFVRGLRWVAGGADGQQMFNSPLLEAVVGHPAAAGGRTPLRGVDAPDRHTLRIHLRWPVDDLPALMSDPVLAPRPAVPQDATGVVGNGPFRLSEPWARNQYLRLQRHDAHPSPALLDEVVFLVYATVDGPELVLQDFQQGVLDVSPVPITRRDEVAAVHGPAATERPRTGPGVVDVIPPATTWLGFNTGRAPWGRSDIRRAVGHLSQAATSESVPPAGLDVAVGILPPSLPGLALPCAACDGDAASAARILEGQGELVRTRLADGPMRIVVPRGHPGAAAASQVRQGLVTVLASVLGERPDIDVEALAPSEYVAALRSGDHDLYVGTWNATWPTSAGMLVPMFHSRHIGSTNLGRVDVGFVDAALDELTGAPAQDRLDRDVNGWRELELELRERALVVPLWWHPAAVVVAPDVVGYTVAPTGDVDLSIVSVAEE